MLKENLIILEMNYNFVLSMVPLLPLNIFKNAQAEVSKTFINKSKAMMQIFFNHGST